MRLSFARQCFSIDREESVRDSSHTQSKIDASLRPNSLQIYHSNLRPVATMCERIAAGGHAESIEAVKQYQQNEVMAVITDVRLALPDCITWNTRNLPIRCTVFYDLPRMR